MRKLSNVRELFLALALFFNPFGYNELFAFVMSFTKSYWITSLIFYIVAASLFGVYIVLRWLSKRK